jgi:hypothetical protein
MSDRCDRETLLGDILAHGGAADLREAMLRRTLGHVKRRRVLRHARRAGAVLAGVAVLCLLVWRLTLPSVHKPNIPEPSYTLVHTQPLNESAQVQTRPLERLSLVSSTPSIDLVTVGTSLEVPTYQDIDDATLLALAAPKTPVLVRLDSHSAELVFVSDTDTADRRDTP